MNWSRFKEDTLTTELAIATQFQEMLLCFQLKAGRKCTQSIGTAEGKIVSTFGTSSRVCEYG